MTLRFKNNLTNSVLGVYIILMNGKSVDSPWHRMEDVIKIGVSAYQIAFSVVISQGM
jgi:hypothetical protein